MRAFLAINLSDSLKEELVGLQECLEEKTKGIRWLKPEQLHITLKFLGEIDSGSISCLSPSLEDLGRRLSSFKITLSGLGGFPNLRNPRVVWIGVDEGAEQLNLLSSGIEEVYSQKLESVLEEKHGKKSKSKLKNKANFVPHLTLGRRIKKEEASITEDLLKKEWCCVNPLHVDRFCLMQSTLHSSGAKYNILEKFPLFPAMYS